MALSDKSYLLSLVSIKFGNGWPCILNLLLLGSNWLTDLWHFDQSVRLLCSWVESVPIPLLLTYLRLNGGGLLVTAFWHFLQKRLFYILATLAHSDLDNLFYKGIVELSRFVQRKCGIDLRLLESSRVLIFNLIAGLLTSWTPLHIINFVVIG